MNLDSFSLVQMVIGTVDLFSFRHHPLPVCVEDLVLLAHGFIQNIG